MSKTVKGDVFTYSCIGHPLEQKSFNLCILDTTEHFTRFVSFFTQKRIGYI